MMKFFRKYTKVLLAVFMSLLLVVWLLGDIINQATQAEDVDATPRGVVYGREVSLRDMKRSFSDASILEWVGLRYQMLPVSALSSVVGDDPNMMQMYYMQMMREPLAPDDWYLLDAEARTSGVIVPQEAVDRFKNQMQITGERIASVRDRHGVSVAMIDEAIRSYVRVLDVIDLASKSLKPSEADIRDFVRQTQEQVRVATVVVDAAKFVDTDYQPSDEEIERQFEENKDKDPVPGSSEQFGYRLPERAQVEYIKVDVKAVAARQELPGDDDLYAYWESRKSEFMQPTVQPTTGPAATQPQQPKPYETFSEARAKVVEKLRDERSRAETLRLARDAIGRLSRPWETVTTTQPGGYRQPPESEKAADLYDRLAAGFEDRYPGVFKVVRLGLLDQNGLSALAEVGGAMASRGTRQGAALPQAAFYVAGLEAKREDNPDHARLFRNIYETCSEPFTDGEGNVFIMRVTAAEAKHPPASWQDVREQVVADLRNLYAAKQARERAEALSEKAAQMGLKEAFQADADLLTKLEAAAYKTPSPFARQRSFSYAGRTYVQPNYISGVGAGDDLINLCFDMAAETATQPVRVKVHKLEHQQQWVVIEFKELLPVTEAEYQQARAEAFNYIMLQRRVDFLKNWFDVQQIRERVGWKDLLPEKAKTEEGDKPKGEAESS